MYTKEELQKRIEALQKHLEMQDKVRRRIRSRVETIKDLLECERWANIEADNLNEAIYTIIDLIFEDDNQMAQFDFD